MSHLFPPSLLCVGCLPVFMLHHIDPKKEMRKCRKNERLYIEILEGRKEDDEKRSKKRRKSNGDDMLDFVDWLIMKSPPALASKFHVEYINHDPKHQPKCFSISGRDSIINPRRYLCLTWAIEPQRGGSRHVITPSFSRRLLPPTDGRRRP